MYNDIQPVIPCFIHWFMQRFCPVFVPMLGRLPWPLLQLAAVAGAVPGALLAVLISGAGALHQLAHRRRLPSLGRLGAVLAGLIVGVDTLAHPVPAAAPGAAWGRPGPV